MAAADYKALVQSIYISYFGRPADTFGLANFSAQLDALHAPLTVNGLTAAYTTSPALKALIDSFGASAESTALYGTDTVAFVSAIYNNVLNRSPDFDGLVFWATEINAGRLTKANASLAIMAGAINNTSAQGLIDAQVLANKVTIATNFTTAIDTGVELAAYSGNAAAAVAREMLKTVTATTVPATFQATVDATLLQLVNGSTVGATFALTTSIDNFTGTSGNDTFNAVPATGGIATFGSLDSINGGGGNDTLIVTSAGALDLSTAAGATVSNIENVTLAAAGTITANVSSFTGVNELIVSSAAGSVITAGASTNVTEAGSIAATSITGGKNVTVVHKVAGNVAVINAAGDVNVNSTVGTVSVTGAAGAVTIAAKGDITGSGKVFTGSALGATAYADKIAHRNASTAAGDAVTFAGWDVDDADAMVVALTALNADLALATSITTNNEITRDAVIDGVISVTQKVAIDAAFSAAINAPAVDAAAALAAARAATAAIDAPLLTAAVAAQAAAVSAESLAVSAASPISAVYAADLVALNDNVAANIAINASSKVMTSATLSGNYLAAGNSTITDTSTLSNVLTSVSLANGGAAVLNGNAIATVSMKDYFKSVTINNGTLNHALTLNLDNVGGTGTTVTDLSATTLNVNTATASSAILNTGSATSVKFAGAGSMTVVAAGSSFAATAAFDASAATGAVSLTVGATQSFIGGAGNDAVTTGALAQTTTLDGGAGTDRLVLTNNANFAGAAAAKFVGFETLQLNGTVSADVTAFTGSTFTGVVLNNGVKVIGLNAAQAGNITVRASGTYEIGVAGATTVGQLDTVKLIVSDGSSGVSTVTLTTPNLAGVEVLNLTASDNVIINTLTSATALTNINIDGSKEVSITTGAIPLNVNTVIDAHAATGAVTVNATGALANGLKIIGSGSGVNTLTGNAFASVLVGGQNDDTLTGGVGSDVITSGNGNNTIVGGAGAGGDTVLVGNGQNSITLDGTGAATVTAGNGFNVITTGAGNDKIIVGTGGNDINAGAGGDIITFGAHVAGVVDSISYTTATETFAGSFVSGVTPLNATLNGIDVVTGMHAGDIINIGAFGFAAGVTIGAGAAADNGVSLIKGTYNATTHIFTASLTGTDAVLQFDTNAANATVDLNSIVLVGFTGTVAAGVDGVLTLV
jgi:hypothetical protein